MEVDESIVLLGAELDAWWDEFSPLLDTDDSAAQATALLRGFEIAKRFNRLKTQGLTAIQALLDRHGATEDVEPASLVRAFAFAAKLANTLHDEFRDIDGETQVARFTEAIVKTLEESEAGRIPLAVLPIIPMPACALGQARASYTCCLIALSRSSARSWRRRTPIARISRPILPSFAGSTIQNQVRYGRVGRGESAVPMPHLWLKY